MTPPPVRQAGGAAATDSQRLLGDTHGLSILGKRGGTGPPAPRHLGPMSA